MAKKKSGAKALIDKVLHPGADHEEQTDLPGEQDEQIDEDQSADGADESSEPAEKSERAGASEKHHHPKFDKFS